MAFLLSSRLRLDSGTSSVQDMAEARTGKKVPGCVLSFFKFNCFSGDNPENPVISHALRRRCGNQTCPRNPGHSLEASRLTRRAHYGPCLAAARLVSPVPLSSFSLLSVPGDRGATVPILELQQGWL